MCNKIIAGGPLGAEVMDECVKAVDYERDVGIIELLFYKKKNNTKS